VVDTSGVLVMANSWARRMFGLGTPDYGRPLSELEVSYRPVDLRTHLDTQAQEPRAIDIPGVRWTVEEQERILDVHLSPLIGEGVVMGTSISFRDATETDKLRVDLKNSRRELEQAYEELQLTVEELESTNAELESTNEELESTNEELESTNEELETMNEELRSSNEELETMNDELRQRSTELNDMNAFLETILTTMGLAVAVLDSRENVQIWNGQARDLWGLSAEEAGDRHMLALDIGLPMDKLRHPLRRALSDPDARQELVVEATNRRGRTFQCRIVCLPLTADGDGVVSGVIVLMEPVP